MARLSVYNTVSLDGYFSGPNDDLSWAHSQDEEWQEHVQQNAMGGGRLLLGRVTYEMMAGFWPTEQAAKNFPVVAERMNSLPKFVFSRMLRQANWNNTTLLKGDLAAEARKLKAEPGKDLVILGSGSIVAQLSREGLIDEYQVVVCPVVLGQGRTMFDGARARLPLRLIRSRTFGNGNVLLCYEPSKA